MYQNYSTPKPCQLCKRLTNQPGTLWSWTSLGTQFPDGPSLYAASSSRREPPSPSETYLLILPRVFTCVPGPPELQESHVKSVVFFWFPPCQWDKVEDTLGDKPTEKDTTSQTIRKTTSETRPKTNLRKRTRFPRPDGKQVVRHHRKQGGQKTEPKDCGRSIPHQRQEKTGNKTGNKVGLQTGTSPYCW